MRNWLIAIVVIIILAGLGYWAYQSLTGSDDEVVQTSTPEFRDIQKTAMVSGNIQPSTDVELKSSVSGILDEVMVSVGDSVERGEKVARIQIVPEPEQINNAESDVEVARLNYERARENYERQKELYENDVVSRNEYEEARNNYEVRKRELNSAQNRLEILREGATAEMEETSNIIRSTMDGMVLSIPAKEGSSIMGRGNFNEGTAVMVIADMDNMVFQGQVGESEVAMLEPGLDMELQIGARPNETYEAMLGFIAPRGVEEQGRVQYDISALVESKEDNVLRAGYSANADVIIEEKEDVLSIEERYLNFEDGQAKVRVKQEDGSFETQPVETGISDGVHIEIKEGLDKDDEFRAGQEREFREL